MENFPAGSTRVPTLRVEVLIATLLYGLVGYVSF